MVSRTLLILVPLLFSLPVRAQNSYGRFTGRVIDQQGALVMGAKVKIQQAETNASAETVTNQEGVYDLLNQLPGSYVLVVESSGFKKHTRSGLVLRVGDIVELNVALELGAVTDSVPVTAAGLILVTGTASLGQPTGGGGGCVQSCAFWGTEYGADEYAVWASE
jgi:Tfp pilus assembly pilus retraction ATPase PilT